MTRTPSFPGPEPGAARARFVPVALDFETEGHFLLFYLRVDGKNLEPSAGGCRRWLLQRVAREAESAERSFCGDDTVRFRVAAGALHQLEIVVGSEHTVVKRVVLRPGENVRWRMQVRTGRVELPLALEAGHAYTIEARERIRDLRAALAKQAPSGTSWDPGAYEPVYHSGVEVGSLRIRVLRDRDAHVVSELSVPLYSGRIACEPPFCP